jgi:hypothetical protein
MAGAQPLVNPALRRVCRFWRVLDAVVARIGGGFRAS